MHRKYAADGLVVMSLDIEPSEWGESKEKVLKFLTEKEATFPNYIFRDREEKVEHWKEKHAAEYTPAVVLFNRDGNRVPVPKFKDEQDEEAFIKKLLGK